MRVSSSLVLVLAIALSQALPCAAQDGFAEKSVKTFPDEDVTAMMKLALENIQQAHCEENKPCAPATPEELANPPLSIEEARRVMIQGSVTALAELCGLDYNRSFLPLMAQYRKQKADARKLALVALLHGISQGRLAGMLKRENAKCSEDMRTKFDKGLPKLPQ